MDRKIITAGFAGFGEVNTPKDILTDKCGRALSALKSEGVMVTAAVYPITDDSEGRDCAHALRELSEADFDTLVLCVAGWIPSHAVLRVAEHFRHIPVVLWGLAGQYRDGRLITTADQAGTCALRGVMDSLGYTFKFIYDTAASKTKSAEAARYCAVSSAVKALRSSKCAMIGYRDMKLYGTMFDGISLKRVTGIEIEFYEMLEAEQRYNSLKAADIDETAGKYTGGWKFLSEPDKETVRKTAGYYLAVSAICRENGCGAVSIKDVDGMKKLLGFPPAPVFMLLADVDGLCTVPENDALGSATQLMIKALTGQCGAYLEFYEFMEDRLLAGVPDFIPREITDGDITVMPAAFGGLSQGILNVSKVKTGPLTLCRLFYDYSAGGYAMHMLTGEGVRPRAWEEAGWTQPAPQLPGLEILPDGGVEAFARKVMSQHYFIAYGDITAEMGELCSVLGIRVV